MTTSKPETGRRPGTLTDTQSRPYWSLPAGDLFDGLGSASTGLRQADARRVLLRLGPNQIDAARSPSALRVLARQFLSPILLILLAATAMSALLGDPLDASIIAVIIVCSGLLGFWQEHQAGRAMKALLRLVAVDATVLRDGQPVTVPVAEVVPGDVVRLRAGDLVPGDGVVLASRGLQADESVMTGEAFPVSKKPGTCPPDAPVNDRPNSLFLGTHVASGTGTVLIVATGRGTEIGAVARELGSTRTTTGFERGLTSFGLLLTRVMLVLVVTMLAVNIALDRPVVESALFSLALAVGLTPQLLPAIVSISLAQGARAMARERVIVRRLDSIEDFGSMDVLCSDKTGTMTEGRVVLDAALGPDGRPSEYVAHVAYLNAKLQTGLDNPIDAAVIEAYDEGVQGADEAAVDQLPYDFERKRISVLVRDLALGRDPVLITKGALEPVMALCHQVRDESGRIRGIDEARDDVMNRFAELSSHGFRVLGVAVRPMPAAESLTPGDESALTLVGLLTFADPPKAGAHAVIRELQQNGISVRMITGDNRLVAAHIAAAVGLDHGGSLAGHELETMDQESLRAAVRTVSVFSEVSPLHKERIVRALRENGGVVGYLGDGINDAAALRAADVGISVDTAVAVAKQSAAIVLLDKNLDVLLSGIRQGRRTFANTMKYIFITTSANFGNMLSMAVAAVVLPFLPLLAAQILLINLLTDLPGTMIATDVVDEPELMRPHQRNVHLIERYMLVFGALSSVFDLTTFAVLRWGFDAGAEEFRSTWFLGSILTEVWVLFVLRTRRSVFSSRPGGLVAVSSAVVVAVTILLPWTPVAAAVHVQAVPASLLAAVVAIALAYVATTELAKRTFWRRESSRPA